MLANLLLVNYYSKAQFSYLTLVAIPNVVLVCLISALVAIANS